MKNDALKYFLLSLAVFGLTIGLGKSVLNGKSVLYIGYAASFVFGIISIIIAAKNIRKRHGQKNINILAIIGAGIITAMYIVYIVSFAIYYLSDLPTKP